MVDKNKRCPLGRLLFFCQKDFALREHFAEKDFALREHFDKINFALREHFYLKIFAYVKKNQYLCSKF